MVAEQFRVQGIKPIAGATIEIATSQWLIATMTDVSRQTVSRQVRSWQQARAFKLTAGRLRLFRPDDLEQLTVNRQS